MIPMELLDQWAYEQAKRLVEQARTHGTCTLRSHWTLEYDATSAMYTVYGHALPKNPIAALTRQHDDMIQILASEIPLRVYNPVRQEWSLLHKLYTQSRRPFYWGRPYEGDAAEIYVGLHCFTYHGEESFNATHLE